MVEFTVEIDTTPLQFIALMDRHAGGIDSLDCGDAAGACLPFIDIERLCIEQALPDGITISADWPGDIYWDDNVNDEHFDKNTLADKATMIPVDKEGDPTQADPTHDVYWVTRSNRIPGPYEDSFVLPIVR